MVNMTALKCYYSHRNVSPHDATLTSVTSSHFCEVYSQTVSWKLQLYEGLESLLKMFSKHRWKALMGRGGAFVPDCRKKRQRDRGGKKNSQQTSALFQFTCYISFVGTLDGPCHLSNSKTFRYKIHRPIKGPETDRSAKINWQSLAASVMLQLRLVAEQLTSLLELISATDPMWPCLPHPTPRPPTSQRQSSPRILHETMRVK